MADLSPQKLLSKESKEKFIINARKFVSGDDDGKPKLRASVLILMCVVDNDVSVIFTLRSSKLRREGGEISLPGGKLEAGETSIETALRETYEELGIPSSEIVIWSELPKIVGVDNEFCLTPVVGFLPNFDINKLKPNKDEVDKVYVVPIKSLVNKNNIGYRTFNKSFPLYLFNCPETENRLIWGITGFMVALFLLCLLPNNIYNGDLTDAVNYDNYKPSNKAKL